MSTINNDIYKSIKKKLDEENKPTKYSNILKLETDKTYEVRLLPNVKDPENSIFHYYFHGWKSFSTGEYKQAVSPQTFGEPDPIIETRLKYFNTGTEEEKEKAKALNRKQNWMVNVYVISDPTNPENEGTVKILKFGKQLHDVITSTLNGDDEDEDVKEENEMIGFTRVFDLGPEGCNLKINVKDQGGFPNYQTSKFTRPKAVPGIKEADYQKILDQVFDLTDIHSIPSYDELKEMLNDHYFNKKTSIEDTQDDDVDDGDDEYAPTTVSSDIDEDDDDIDVDEILAAAKED